jgi:hypothetical protein
MQGMTTPTCIHEANMQNPPIPSNGMEFIPLPFILSQSFSLQSICDFQFLFQNYYNLFYLFQNITSWLKFGAWLNTVTSMGTWQFGWLLISHHGTFDETEVDAALQFGTSIPPSTDKMKQLHNSQLIPIPESPVH